jgi:hypothetical protein
LGAIAALDKDKWGCTEIHREPKEVQPVPATKGKAVRTKPYPHSPLQMLKPELIAYCDKLEVKVCKHEATIKDLKKNMKNGVDDGEGGQTYKQLYESQNRELQEMMRESDRVTDINAKLQEDIQTLKTAAANAEIEKALFKKDFDAKVEMLAQFKEDNKELKALLFRTHHQSTYGATGSMSVRGPSPNENTPT